MIEQQWQHIAQILYGIDAFTVRQTLQHRQRAAKTGEAPFEAGKLQCGDRFRRHPHQPGLGLIEALRWIGQKAINVDRFGSRAGRAHSSYCFH